MGFKNVTIVNIWGDCSMSNQQLVYLLQVTTYCKNVSTDFEIFYHNSKYLIWKGTYKVCKRRVLILCYKNGYSSLTHPVHMWTKFIVWKSTWAKYFDCYILIPEDTLKCVTLAVHFASHLSFISWLKRSTFFISFFTYWEK